MERSQLTDDPQSELLPCPDCGAPMSPYVCRCPRCGRHLRKRAAPEAQHLGAMRKGLWIAGAISVLAITALAMWMIYLIDRFNTAVD